MKNILSFITACLIFTSCTEKGFYEEPEMTRLRIISSSPDRYFSVWLDDELFNDSLNASYTDPVKVGKRRLQIAESGKEGKYIIDTLVDIKRPMTSFTLLEIDPSQPPFLFTGFDEEVTPPTEGFYKFCLLNTDTVYSRNRRVTLRLIDWDMVTVVFEMENAPQYQLSPFYEIPVGMSSAGGVLEIVDADDPSDVLLTRDNFVTFYPAFANMANNIFILKLYMGGDESWRYFAADEVYSEKR